MSCRTCEMVARRDAGDAPPWDCILRTPEWDVVHAYDTSHEGWLVIVLRRHVHSMSELTDREATELGRLTRDVSVALEEVLGVPRTYVVQFAEHPLHPCLAHHVVRRRRQRGPRAAPHDDPLGQVVELHAVALQRPVETVQHVNPLPRRPRGPGHWHLHPTLLDDLLDSHHLDHAVDDFDCGEAGVGGTPLLPRAVAAGTGAPLRDAPAGRNGHLCPAPSADDLLPWSARRCWCVPYAGHVAGRGVHGRLR